jgi:UDP-glucose 4-epimerase
MLLKEQCVAKVVVIGANGFIGSHLVDALVEEGHEVTAFDRFRSVQPSFATKNIRILSGDFLSRADLEDAVEGQDLVFHFLSSTNPATAQSDPTLDIRTNVAQTVELLEACVKAQIKHFYFASTGGAVYGPQKLSRFGEEDLTLPVSPYAIGKLSIENYLRYFDVVHGLSSTTLRISNPYGPRQKANRRQGLIPIVLRQILIGEPVVRFGDGSMIRDYIYVGNLVSMIARMVGSPRKFGTYNMGSGEGHSVSDVLDVIHRMTKRDFVVVEKPTPASFVGRVVLDTSRYAAEFGTVQLTGLDEGIAQTFEYMEREING